jgi:hypothetical protein
MLLSGCGGGSSSTSALKSGVVGFPPSAATLQDSNVVAISVESGPGNNINIPYVNVTVCTPGTNNCKTIDHVLLDTGSTGLRIFASVLNAAPALTLPAQQVGASSTITECAQFLNSVAWGTVKLAEVRLGGKVAASVPVQVLEPNMPAALSNGPCGGNSLQAMDKPSALGANGVLGLSLFTSDKQRYFDCVNPNPNCQINAPANKQVQNPVGLFSSDNNGVLVQLPALGTTGASKANGYLILGVETRANNILDTANVVPVNSSGFFTTTLGGYPYGTSFIDSGSNGLFFSDPLATLNTHCNFAAAGFYCPPSARPFSANIQLGFVSAVVNFTIDNADNLFQNGNYAFNNVGGTFDSTSFDWGLPFFFGRSVFTVIEGKSAGVLTGPFYAFTN